MEKIGKYQIIAMTILFMIGSTPLYELGIAAKQDAWLVMLAAMIAGSLLLYVYLFIQHRNPDRNLSQILNQHFGKYIGFFITAAYIVYFAYESMRNTREFSDIINISFLPSTPLYILILIMVLLSGYAVSQGIEVFFRVAEFMLPFTLIGYILIVIMFIGSNIIHLDRLMPILENGVLPVLRESLPEVISFPFGQIVLFLMFWSHLDDKKTLSKTTFSAYIFVGIILLIFNILNLSILDPSITSITTFPLLRSVRLIEIADFLERLDPLIIMLIYIGIFVKMTAFYLGAVLGLSSLIKISHKKLTVIVGAFIYSISFLSPNFIYHIWIGFNQNLKYHFPIFQICIPLILALIILIKGPRSSKSR